MPVDDMRNEYDYQDAHLNTVEAIDRLLGTSFRETHDRGLGGAE
jgi:hypothetical protein